jgi:hypothetical protein
MFEHEGTVKHFRAGSAAVFIFDCSRFLFLIALLSVLLKTGPGLGVATIPLMMYAAPNALFPLMSFFLLTRHDDSGAYVPLYIVGKALCVLCAFVWLLFLMRQEQGFLASRIMWLLFLSAADLGTIIGTALSVPKEAEAPAETAEITTMTDNVKITLGGE